MNLKKSIWVVLGLAVLLMGAKAIKDRVILVGDGTAADIEMVFDIGAGSSNPRIKWDNATSRLQFTNDNVNIFDIGSGSGSGGGGTNIIANPGAENSETNWTFTGGGSFASTDTAANVALGGKAFEMTATAASDVLASDAVDIAGFKTVHNRLCVASAWYLGGGPNITMQVWDGTQAIKSLVLETATVYKSTGDVTFVCPSTGNLQLRFLASAAESVIYIDDVFVGTREVNIGPVITDWVDFTPSWTNAGSRSVENFKWRRVGESMEIQAHVTFSGIGLSSLLLLEVPNGEQIDNSFPIGADEHGHIGNGGHYDSGGSLRETLSLWVSTPTTIGFLTPSKNSFLGTEAASGDMFSFTARFPVEGWEGTATVFQPTIDDLSITAWKVYTPNAVLNNVSNTVNEASFRRVGDTMHIKAKFDLTGVATASINWGAAGYVHNGLTYDVSKHTGNQEIVVGNCFGDDASASSSTDQYVAAAVVNTAGTISCRNRGTNDDATGGGDTWSPGQPFSWNTGDSITMHFSVPITQWDNLGSVPPIGVSVVDDNNVGLTGPTLTDFDVTGETCNTNCDDCQVSAWHSFTMGSQVWFSFNVNIDPTVAGQRYDCNFAPPVGSGVDFTSSNDASGVCHTGQTADGATSGGMIFAGTASDVIDVRFQDPDVTSNISHRCVGMYVIK